MWFPHILNSVAEFMNENPGNRTYMCQIVYSKQQSIFDAENAHGAAVSDGVTETATQCIEKLEISTYQHSLVLEVLYAVGFALIGGIINKVGKQVILCKFYNTSFLFLEIKIYIIIIIFFHLFCSCLSSRLWCLWHCRNICRYTHGRYISLCCTVALRFGHQCLERRHRGSVPYEIEVIELFSKFQFGF